MPVDPFGAVTFAYEVCTRGWDWYKTRGAPFRTDDFIEQYSQCMKACIDSVTAVEKLRDDEVAEGTRAVLKMIATVAQALRPEDNVNASYMIPVLPTPELVKRTHFTDSRLPPDAFDRLLVLKMWAKEVPGLPVDFVLPVEKAESGHRAVLFGAPEAYVENRVCFVRDTLRLHKELKAVERKQTREDIESYFREHRNRLRSFASYPVEEPGGPRVIAVVNVQSVTRALMGVSAGNQRRLTMAVSPLLRALAYFVLRAHGREIDGGMQQNPTGNV